MAPPASNANTQVGNLQRFISQRTADRRVTRREAEQIVAEAKQGGVQVGELALLRTLGARKALTGAAKDSFVRAVDALIPDGAPTAQLAAILFRLDPDTGRRQLLDLLARSKNPVAGGPKAFVIRDGVAPYQAAITTGQVLSGLAKFLPGASKDEAVQLRSLMREQLRTLQTPIAKGGVMVPGLTGSRGLAVAAQSAQGNWLAVNQSAFVLRSLEKVLQLEGPANAALVKEAKGVSDKVAIELKADLAFAYPKTGNISYGFRVTNGVPIRAKLEDGDHLLTTLDALRGLEKYKGMFASDVKRIEGRFPELKYAGAEDLDGAPGRIFTSEFNALRDAGRQARSDGVVKYAEAKRLAALADRDGLRTPGERELLRRLGELGTKAAREVLSEGYAVNDVRRAPRIALRTS